MNRAWLSKEELDSKNSKYDISILVTLSLATWRLTQEDPQQKPTPTHHKHKKDGEINHGTDAGTPYTIGDRRIRQYSSH
jgi:hypothetical protein